MAKKPTQKVKAEKPRLLSALEFAATVTPDTGSEYQTHCLLQDGWLTTFDGVTATGHRIDETLTCAPDTKLLAAALKKAGSGFSIVPDVSYLTVRAGRFMARVPVVPIEHVTRQETHPAQIPVDERFTAALLTASRGAGDANSSLTHSVSLTGSLATATDRIQMIQAFTGVAIDAPLVLPIPIIRTLAKTKENVARVGYDGTAITLWLSPDKWIRSQLYTEKWPDLTPIFKNFGSTRFFPLPAIYPEVLDKLEPFTECFVTITDKDIRTEDGSAVIDMQHPVARPVTVNLRKLKLAVELSTKLGFDYEGSRIYFTDDKSLRGVVQLKS